MANKILPLAIILIMLLAAIGFPASGKEAVHLGHREHVTPVSVTTVINGQEGISIGHGNDVPKETQRHAANLLMSLHTRTTVSISAACITPSFF